MDLKHVPAFEVGCIGGSLIFYYEILKNTNSKKYF
jgi:hypothetical protein